MTQASRRKFLQAAAGAVTVAGFASKVSAAEKEADVSHIGKTPHTKFAVNVEMWWTKLPFLERIKKAATFNKGFEQTEYVASALVDMIYHTRNPEGLDPDAFERQTLERLRMPSQIVMRHRSPHFGHIFSGEGYAAGYYGYLWADVLTADAAEAFEKAPGGFYDKELARKLVDHLFAVRNAVDPADAYRAFRGRDAEIGAVMRAYGFPVPPKGE